jgi:hypothetical protein
MAKHNKVDKAPPTNWHPDFRDVQRLPDVRVVRTGIAMTLLSAAAVLASLLYFALQEYSINATGAEREALQAAADEEKASLARRVELNRQFNERMLQVEALAKFGEGRPLGSDTILLISSLRPEEGILFTSIQITAQATTVRVQARSADRDQLLQMPTALHRIFSENPEIQKRYKTITPPNFDPPREGMIEFELLLRP